mmetsp:Transcript_20393/g.50706  ORF Transcript_20393/g.50706 Transcript_20393/m.50706 type:complete len:325 (-) Transcript_20393:368-1342(-)
MPSMSEMPIVGMPMVVVVAHGRSLVVIVVVMHFRVLLHGIRMNSVMHVWLSTIVHVVIVLWPLVLMAWVSLMHLVTMVFLATHWVILSTMRHWWRLPLTLLWMLLLLRRWLWLLLFVGLAFLWPILGSWSIVLGCISTPKGLRLCNGNSYTRRNVRLLVWMMVLLLLLRMTLRSPLIHSILRWKVMVLRVMKVTPVLLLLLHVMLHVVHSVLIVASHAVLNRISPSGTNQSLLLKVMVVVSHVGMTLSPHGSHHWISVSCVGMVAILLLRLHVMLISSHWALNTVRWTKRSHRSIRSRRWRALHMVLIHRNHGFVFLRSFCRGR